MSCSGGEAGLDKSLMGRTQTEHRHELTNIVSHAISQHKACRNIWLVCVILRSSRRVMGGATIEAACERALFQIPEATAAAVSYTSAQLTLLADLTMHVWRIGLISRLALDRKQGSTTAREVVAKIMPETNGRIYWAAPAIPY
jgi:hypothetical protein